MEQYDGAVEQLNSVAQCGGTNGTVWNGMVEQYGTAWWNSMEQHGGTVEQCGEIVWNSMVEQLNSMAEKLNSMVEQ